MMNFQIERKRHQDNNGIRITLFWLVRSKFSIFWRGAFFVQKLQIILHHIKMYSQDAVRKPLDHFQTTCAAT